MARAGTESARRAALIDAAIAEIGEKQSTSVTVGEIARRAGVSSALAHHYFGTKQQILLSAMRRILWIYGDEVLAELASATGPRDRLSAIVRASFAPSNFRPEVVRTWLILYLTSRREPDAARLLAIYRGRLRSNLLHELRPLAGPRAPAIAETVAALIDGFYIRRALEDGAPDMDPADLVLATLDTLLDEPR